MRLREAQAMVDEWIGQFEEGYWPPLANLARLTEEIGELARELNDQFGPKRKKPGEPAGDIALELGDCLFVLICMANSLHIDLEDAFTRTMAKYRTRDANRWTRRQTPAPPSLDTP
ncbi:MAG TPA: nucleotide pyrophosphohydrolase [Limnochordales bacterium]